MEFSDLCFHLYVSSDLGNLDQDEVLEYLFERTQQQENLQLERLAKVFSAFKHVALNSGTTHILLTIGVSPVLVASGYCSGWFNMNYSGNT